MTARVLLFTCFALLCFAGNSLLCRLALASREIDAASFTAIRLASGAGVLALLARPRAERATLATGAERATLRTGSWLSALALFAYAAPFSFSYLSLGAALGALVLFGAVQVTMVGWGILRGERPSALAWLGMALALAGLLGLTWPGRSAPQLMGVVPMIVAGVSWGAYSLRGRTQTRDPIVATAGSFVRSLPFAAALLAHALWSARVVASPRGIALATLSGAIASGVGYSAWYAALPQLSAARAAVVQLLVPVLAGALAIAWLGEPVTLRLVAAGGTILAGVALTITARSTPRLRPPTGPHRP